MMFFKKKEREEDLTTEMLALIYELQSNLLFLRTRVDLLEKKVNRENS